MANKYADAFGVPVIYVNSKGRLEYMPGKMGRMMAKAGLKLYERNRFKEE